MVQPKVSILCITYNHAKFIRQALDGFVMQKTNFPFEVIVHDDASTDGTADIVREYAEKYPDIIKPILQTENQWSRGVSIWKAHMWPRIRGEYVALNEGDDYWTDPCKLQKQIDFMDAHPDFSVCFHPVRVIWDDKRSPDYIFPTPKFRFNKTVLELSDLLQHNFIQTNSVVYRWRPECAELFPDGILPGDWYLHLLHAQVGKIGFLPDVMSVYRRNAGGIWTGSFESDDWFIKCAFPCMKFYKSAMTQFNHDYTKELVFIAASAIRAFLRANQTDKINVIHDTYPEIWDGATNRLNVCDMASMQKRVNKYKKLFNMTIMIVAFVVVMCILLTVFL